MPMIVGRRVTLRCSIGWLARFFPILPFAWTSEQGLKRTLKFTIFVECRNVHRVIAAVEQPFVDEALLAALVGEVEVRGQNPNARLFIARARGTKSPSPVTSTATSILSSSTVWRASTAKATSVPFSPWLCDMGRYFGSTPAWRRSW